MTEGFMMSSLARLPLLAAALILGAFVSGPVGAQAPGLPSADSKAIAAVNETFSAGLLAKDWKGVSSLFAADGVLYPPGESAVKGRASIEACLEAFPPTTAVSLRTTKVDGHGELAYAQGTFALTPAPAGAASPAQESGYFLQVLRRQPNSTWLIAAQMFSPH